MDFSRSGLHVAFYSGVYSSCIAFTKIMGSNTKQLVGYTGIFIGIGEVLGSKLLLTTIITNRRDFRLTSDVCVWYYIAGGMLCSVLGKKSSSTDVKFQGLSRSTVVVISFFINVTAYGLISINLPNDSPFGDTYAKSFIESKYDLNLRSELSRGNRVFFFSIFIDNIWLFCAGFSWVWAIAVLPFKYTI